MERATLLGIDLGTTVLKACAFDAPSGRVLAKAARRLPVRVLDNGGREQDLGAVMGAFRAIIRDIRSTLGTRWKSVAGIGFAAQGGSSIIADRSTGQAHTPMILWSDGRAYAENAQVAASVPTGFWRKHVLCDIPPAGLGRFLWLRKHRPSLFSEANIHVGAGDYLFFHLTGVWRQDAGNAVQIGSYSASSGRLFQKALDLVDVPFSFVAPLRQGHETAPLSSKGARLLNLSEGIPVAGPYIDQEAGYLSAQGVAPRPLQCSLGTAWVGNFLLPPHLASRSFIQLVLPAPVGEGGLIVQPLLTGNVAWDWALTTFVNARRDKALAQASTFFRERLLPPHGLVAVPWLAQPNPLAPSAQGAGIFSGVSPATDPRDFVRAVASGMVCELARVLASATESGLVDSVVLSGGASKGEWFRDLAAALFAPLPVFWQADEDVSAARGALFAFGSSAARAKVKRVRVPSVETVEAVRAHYGLYCTIVDRAFGALAQKTRLRIRRRAQRNTA